MNEIFNPSLVISLGPSGRKALEFSKKLLSYLPKHFLDVIDYYSVEETEGISKDLQEIIDSKLLSAKYLNKLMDLGYKVRTENISSVRINLYLLWDVYNSDFSADEIVRTLSTLNYGNTDKDMHSGVTIFIIPIMEKEWLLEEAEGRASIEELKQIINFISEKDNILFLDSKVYVLHCVSNDGTRVSIEELQYIGGLLSYLNIIPSEDPPLSHFKKRILMEERKYKVGTIGITTLMVFKDKLLEDFSKYMAVDILKYASRQESGECFEGYLSYHQINYNSQRSILSNDINLIKENDYYILNSVDKFEDIIANDVLSYPKTTKELEQFIDRQYLPDMKETIDNNSNIYLAELKENIEDDLKRIALKFSLKDSLKYLNTLKEKAAEDISINKTKINVDTDGLNVKLEEKVNNVPNLEGYILKCAILAAFFLYSLINIVFPVFFIIPCIVIVVILYGVFLTFVYIDYCYVHKQLKRFLEMYKKEILKKYGELINLYIEDKIADNQNSMQDYLSQRIKIIESCILHCVKTSKEVTPIIEMEEEGYGNLITNLLDSRDRHNFYIEKSPRVCDLYRKFVGELSSFEEFQKENLKGRIIEFSLKTSDSYVDLDFYEYLKFKYKQKSIDELSHWLDKGTIKSTYLLQYINNDSLEEYSLFITSPEVNIVTKDMNLRNLADYEPSIVDGANVCINTISLIKVCLGIDFESIAAVKKTKKGDKNV
jgi:hypothetical protein